MKKTFYFNLTLCLLLFTVSSIKAQPPTYELHVNNILVHQIVYPNDAIDFDVRLKNPAGPAFVYAAGQYYFYFNTVITSDPLIYTIVTSGLPSALRPVGPRVGLPGIPNVLCLAGNLPQGISNSTTIPITPINDPGILIAKMRLRRTSGTFGNQPLNLQWKNNIPGSYTKIFAYNIDETASDITTPETHIIDITRKIYVDFHWQARSNPDTLKIQVRRSVSPYTIIDSSTIYPTVAGSHLRASLGLANVITGNSYYVVLQHRNSIETWSANPVTITGDSTVYNFTTSLNKAYGNNMILVGGIASVYNGDVNQDGAIDLTDGSLIDNDVFNFVSGYTVTDVNGDEAVDIADQAIADNNAFNFVSIVRP